MSVARRGGGVRGSHPASSRPPGVVTSPGCRRVPADMVTSRGRDRGQQLPSCPLSTDLLRRRCPQMALSAHLAADDHPREKFLSLPGSTPWPDRPVRPRGARPATPPSRPSRADVQARPAWPRRPPGWPARTFRRGRPARPPRPPGRAARTFRRGRPARLRRPPGRAARTFRRGCGRAARAGLRRTPGRAARRAGPPGPAWTFRREPRRARRSGGSRRRAGRSVRRAGRVNARPGSPRPGAAGALRRACSARSPLPTRPGSS